MKRFQQAARVAVKVEGEWMFGTVIEESAFADGGVTIEPWGDVGRRVNVSKSQVREADEHGNVATHYHLVDEDGERALGWHADWNGAQIAANRLGWDGIDMTVVPAYGQTRYESCDC